MLYISTPGWLDSMSHLAFPSSVLSGISPNPYVLNLFSECSLHDPALAETCPFPQGHYFPYCILDDRWELELELFFLVLSTLLSRVVSPSLLQNTWTFEVPIVQTHCSSSHCYHLPYHCHHFCWLPQPPCLSVLHPGLSSFISSVSLSLFLTSNSHGPACTLLKEAMPPTKIIKAIPHFSSKLPFPLPEATTQVS